VKYTDPDGKTPAAALAIPFGDIALGAETSIAISGSLAAIGLGFVSAIPLLITSDNVNTKRQSDGFLYHATTSADFVEGLAQIGLKAVDSGRLQPQPETRFGKALYCAEDPNTAMIENGRPALTVVKFSLSADAKVLDLTNPAVAKAMGYRKGMTHDQVMSLMSTWDLSGIDAIRFASEKDSPYGVCWAVLNWNKLKFEGIYDGQ